MTGHKPWPPNTVAATARYVQYDDKFASLKREIKRSRRIRRAKDAAWAFAALLGFIAMLMVGGCSSTPSVTPWCPDAARDARNACIAEYGPGRRGVTGYGETQGYEYHCMMVGQAARQRCER